MDQPNTIIVEAPGRINLIGEHTDYNGGYVFPAAIDKKITLSISKNGSDHNCQIYAENIPEKGYLDLSQANPTTDQLWLKYVLGVVEELRKRGANIKGFDATFSGTVPLGSGMSSSAALECAFAYGLNELFDLGFDKKTLIKVSQFAEHNYVGTKCGVMDQYASIMGKQNHAMLLDCQTEEHEYFPIDLGDYQLLLLNTNVSHSLANSEYNTRRKECEESVQIIQRKYPKVQTLRDVSLEQLQEFKDQLPIIHYKRCTFVVSENNRVLSTAKALKDKELAKIGKLMYASHDGLKNDYQVSCSELDFLVDQTQDKDYILGARMMGGGFGGCTINIIKKDKVSHFLETVAPLYKTAFKRDFTPYSVSIEGGATRKH